MSDLGNNSVFSMVDGSNNSGTMPSWSGSAAPSTLDDAGRALQGAVTREWNWRNPTVTSGGGTTAYTLTYSVAPAAYYNGQRFAFIVNATNTASCSLNVNSLGAKTIKSMLTGTLATLASGDLVAGMYVDVAYNTANDCFVWMNQKTPASALPTASDTTSGIVELATTTEVLTGTDTARAVTPNALAALWEHGGSVASASVVSLGEGGVFNITGTTTITDIDFATDLAGRSAWVKFAGALTLTHNASTLILPGGANITTAAGDVALFTSEGTDIVRCLSYTKASGLPVVSPTSGGLTQLGSTLTTTGASSVTASGLTLTSYKKLYIVVTGLSSGTGPFSMSIAGKTVSPSVNVANSVKGYCEIDLTTGYGHALIDTSNPSAMMFADFAITTASTSVAFAVSTGVIDVNTGITLYGVA